MATANLNANPRTERGTGVARKLRQSGQVPAIIYGHSREPQSLAIDTRELERRVDPSNIPNHVDVDVTPLVIGHSIHVRELNIPAGVEVLDDPDATVCTVSAPRASETPVAGVAVVEAAAEPELIRKTKEGDEEGGEES